MPYRARVLRRASAKRAEAVLLRRQQEPVTLCNRPIEKCLTVGSHHPVCRCVMAVNHFGPCTSGNPFDKWWKK